MNPSKVPAPAQASFSKAYSKVSDVKWEKADGNFKAVFKEGGNDVKVTYNDKGERIMTEYGMDMKQMPTYISKYVADHYNNANVRSFARVDKPGSPVNYLAEIKGKTLLFGANGQFEKEMSE